MHYLGQPLNYSFITNGALGVASFSYLPYAFLCLLRPIIAIVYACTGWTIEHYDDGEKPAKVRRFRIPKRI